MGNNNLIGSRRMKEDAIVARVLTECQCDGCDTWCFVVQRGTTFISQGCYASESESTDGLIDALKRIID